MNFADTNLLASVYVQLPPPEPAEKRLLVQLKR